MGDLVLHDYWRSSAGYRVRIALALKGLSYRRVAHDLVAGEQRAEAYRTRAPQGLVPMLEVGGADLTQSLAIIDYLDARWPEPQLIPTDPLARALALAAALIIVAEVHPLNNLRVLKRLAAMGVEEGERTGWYRHWVAEGFAALEAVAPEQGLFGGEAPDLVDVCLVPQMYNARRFDCPLEPYPKLVRIDAALAANPGFAAAHPDRFAPATA